MSTPEFKILQWILKVALIVPCAIVFCYFSAFLPFNDPDSSSRYWDEFGSALVVTLGFSLYLSQNYQIAGKGWVASILKLIAIVFGCTLISLAFSFLHILKWGR